MNKLFIALTAALLLVACDTDTTEAPAPTEMTTEAGLEEDSITVTLDPTCDDSDPCTVDYRTSDGFCITLFPWQESLEDIDPCVMVDYQIYEGQCYYAEEYVVGCEGF